MKKQLKDVCEGFTKNIAQKDLSANNGKYPIFGASGIIKTIDFYISDKPYIGIVKDGSGVGRTNKYPAKSSLLGTMQYILPNQGIDLDYLMYGIRFLHLGENYSGAAIPHIYFKVYKNRTLDFPELAEQKHRSIVLNKIQDAINVKEKQLFELENIIQSEFVEMFGENPVESGKWKVEDVGTLSTEVKYGTSSPAVENGKYKYLRMNNITTTGYLDLNDLKYINISDEEYEKCVVRKGDIVFNRTNSREHVGKTCLYDLDEEMIIAGYLIRVRLNNTVNPRFFSEFMNIPYMKLVLRKTARGAVNQSNINSQELKRLKIPVPPLDLQNQFAAFVQQIDKSKFVVKQQITDLQELLDSKMQEYFS